MTRGGLSWCAWFVGAVLGLFVLVLILSPDAGRPHRLITAQRATTTRAPVTSTTTTTKPDLDLGRRLVVRPEESTGDIVQKGPLWIGLVFGLAATAGISYALVERPRRARPRLARDQGGPGQRHRRRHRPRKAARY